MAFDLGKGVKIENANTPLSETEQKAKKEALAKVFAKGTWGPKPVLKDQLIKFTATARREAKQVCILKLNEEKNVEKLNELLLKTHPVESPEIIIAEQDKYFSETHNEVTYVIQYYPVSYLQLDPKGFQLLANS